MKNKIAITESLMKRFLIPVLIVLCCSFVTSAQISKKAKVGFRFLENPVSAEAVGRGMTGIINTINSEAVFWNPALLGLIENTADLSFNHTKGIADINYNAASVSYRVEGIGVFGLSFMAMDYGTFYRTVRAGNENGYLETGEFSPSSMCAGLSFSQQISTRFSYGFQIKYAYQDLGDAWISTGGTYPGDATLALKSYNKGAIVGDVGAYYDFQYNGIKFGAVLQNISKEIRYEEEQFPLPFSVNFGGTVEPLLFLMDKNPDHHFSLTVESRHPRDFGEKLKIGGEYSYAGMLFLRGGYVTNYDERKWSVGLGVNYTLYDIPVRINYALQPYGLFGNVHYLSIGFSYK